MMSYLRMYRDKFVESNDLEYIYMNQSLKLVDYMEQIGLGDKIVEIGSQQLKDLVCFLLPFIKETVVYQLSKRFYQLPKSVDWEKKS